MYKNALEKINALFEIDVSNNPEQLFAVLKTILNFDTGHIILAGEKIYFYGATNGGKNFLTEKLKIKDTEFGEIKIARNNKFSQKERNIFKNCTQIISNIIKNSELSKIINLQVEALQEGIYTKNEAYNTIKLQNDFFANFSHELRTPLNSIITSSELLSEKIFGELNEKQEEYLNDVYIAGTHLLGMINDILDMSKLEAKALKLNYTNFNITQNLHEVCNILKPLLLKKNITLEINVANTLTINADYNKVQRIFFNIISNAIKYTPLNGKINIDISKNKNNIIIKIKDNGIGIDKKYHKKIFEKFTQIGNNKNSNGLGLALTKELVKLHKGTISVDSSIGNGAEFTVLLPV